MIKIVIGVVLICISASAWLVLDCMNKKEQELAALANNDVVKARTEAKRRADAKASIDYQINAALANCQAAADKANTDYSALIQQAAPSKRGQIIIPKEVSEGAAAALAAAKAECQKAHDTGA
jgi:hypothetical protein